MTEMTIEECRELISLLLEKIKKLELECARLKEYINTNKSGASFFNV